MMPEPRPIFRPIFRLLKKFAPDLMSVACGVDHYLDEKRIRADARRRC